MEIRNIVQELLFYLNITSGCGHTTTMLNGVNQSDCLIVVPDGKTGITLFKHISKKTISLNDLPRALQGYRKPLAFDNSALLKIFNSVLVEMDSKDEIIQKLIEENQALKNQS